jgi:hypothetical protein
MSYEPKLRPNARNKITDFFTSTYKTNAAYEVAMSELGTALQNLAANPAQSAKPPGLFETRPIYQFALEADGTRREVQVCWCFDPDDPKEETILVTDFKSL